MTIPILLVEVDPSSRPKSIPTDSNGDIILPTRTALATLPELFPSRHNELGFRRPVGLYNTSVSVIITRTVEVVDCLHALSETGAAHTDSRSKARDALLDAQEGLIHGLAQHVEDCRNVLKGFTGHDDRAFRKALNKPPLMHYSQATKRYRSHIGKVVNRIKHGQGRLTLLTGRRREHYIPAYFVAVGLRDGAVGPDPDIHGQGRAAFSFAHDLRFHLCHVLLISSHLARAIEQLTGIIGTDEFESGETTTGDSSLTKVAASVMDLSDTFFPHEYFEAVPILRFVRGHDERRQLVAGFEVFNGVPPGAGETFEMTLEMYANGSTRAWKLP